MIRIVDSRTAALALDVDPRTVQRWVADGTLPNHGTPRRVRVSLDDVATAKTRRAVKAILRA